jgi:hypothetical protein
VLQDNPRALVEAMMERGLMSKPRVVPVEDLPPVPKQVKGTRTYQGCRPRHASPESLPKVGTIRGDGFRFLGGQRFVGKDGVPFWREQWISEEAYTRKKMKAGDRYVPVVGRGLPDRRLGENRSANERKGGRK